MIIRWWILLINKNRDFLTPERENAHFRPERGHIEDSYGKS